MARKQDPNIREFILRNVEGHPDRIASMAADKFGLSRTGIARYMARLVTDGLLVAEGQTRARQYKLKPLVDERIYLDRNGLWNEDTVWREKIRPLMNGVRGNIIDLFQYGVTEMINNVLDHSSSPDLVIFYKQTYAYIEIEILDSGIGIFNKIRQDFKLADARTALFELSKGRLTSDRKRHSGEGIYFTSRMFEEFSILSGHLFYKRARRDGDDWLIEVKDRPEDKKGTFITLKINTDANWTIREVFELYQGDDVYFRKTHVPVLVGRYPGEQLVSRSQAKRILARFPDFSEVILDFTDVSDIGQAFADEIFRVFRDEHPQTVLVAVGTNANVQQMIDYVQNASSPASPPEVF
jgi:anti-sigma regulatory factor (Ser/Thr protein kinase)